MSVYAICPYCFKTIRVERVVKVVCPDCGEQFGFAELQRKRLLIDPRAESRELAAAKDYFKNAEFLGASEHFKKALEANKNSYASQYFISLCDIYLHEAEDDFDVMGAIMDMIHSSLNVMSRSIATAPDKLAFIAAMLSETKIIITRRLTARNEYFETDIDRFRKESIADLARLLELFTIDREKIMLFAPEVSSALMEIVECAVKTCYKAVQTIAIGEELYSPSDSDYRQLSSLCNEYCYFGHSLNPYFDGKSYSPDFTQNNMLNEKVLSGFEKFDESNKQYAKKYLIGDIKSYEDLLKECELARKFTYRNCYRSMCTRQSRQHANLFFDGLKLVYRLLWPRVIINNQKKVEIRVSKFVDIEDYCDTLTRLLVDSYEINNKTADSLHIFYERLYEIIEMYFVPDIEKISKSMHKLNDAPRQEIEVYQRLLFDCACCCAPALRKFVDYSVGRDKMREKLVKICQLATETFLLLNKFKIEELEQSNIYRPILQISAALLDEME